MRRPVVIILVIVGLALVAGLVVMFQRYTQVSSDYRDMKSAEESVRSQYAQAFDVIAEIQDSLSTVALSDSSVRMLARAARDEQKATDVRRNEALERISLINASIERSKERIRKLEDNVRRSGVRIVGMERMLTTLKESLAAKEQLVTVLTGRVDTLTTQVSDLTTTVAQTQDTLRIRDLTIEQKQRDLATVFYIIGSKKMLTDAGVVAARGGLLGIGKTLLQTGKLDESRFTTIDTDRQRVIHTGAARVEVLSAQPVASYTLQLVDAKVDLQITNPAEFRKVKHLVVMTK
jgi:hypothetical protein